MQESALAASRSVVGVGKAVRSASTMVSISCSSPPNRYDHSCGLLREVSTEGGGVGTPFPVTSPTTKYNVQKNQSVK